MSITIHHNYGQVNHIENSQVVITPSKIKSTAPEIISKPIQHDNKGRKSANPQPYTIKYVCRNKEEQNQRLQILLRKWVEWEWIEDVKNADYFFDFFSGDILNCNLKWIGKNKATLYELLKTILEQPYIQKKENCTARSIAVGQFKEPNIRANKSRVNNTDQWRIIVSSLLLNPSKQLPKPKREAEKELDFSDNALNILFSNDLHVTRNL